MDSTPPPDKSNPNSQTRTPASSRLARITYSIENEEPPHISLDLIPSAAKKTPSTPSSSLKSSTNTLSFNDLLLLSPSPRKSRIRLADRLEMAEEAAMEPNGTRKRYKSKAAQMGCASPRHSSRRSRRRSEIEIREERDLVEEIGKVRKRRHSGRSKKEKLSLVPSPLPSSIPSPKVDDGGEESNLDRIGMIIHDLIMWKDVAKSSLWFGFGCLSFLSCCFAKGISFSIFSAISQLGLIFLGASFLSNSICKRNSVEKRSNFKLKEEDILKLGRLILPPANLAISKTRELFSGEPSMTLKVIPFLLLGAEYGHLVTLWRLFAFGFFIGFTIPKLYSSYYSQINQKVDYIKCRILEAWEACSHKKIVAGSAVTAFWNLSSIKTRVFAAFIFLVILRCCRQHLLPKQAELEPEPELELEPERALVLVEKEKASPSKK